MRKQLSGNRRTEDRSGTCRHPCDFQTFRKRNLQRSECRILLKADRFSLPDWACRLGCHSEQRSHIYNHDAPLNKKKEHPGRWHSGGRHDKIPAPAVHGYKVRKAFAVHAVLNDEHLISRSVREAQAASRPKIPSPSKMRVSFFVPSRELISSQVSL